MIQQLIQKYKMNKTNQEAETETGKKNEVKQTHERTLFGKKCLTS